MTSEENSVGSMHAGVGERKKFAKESFEWNMKNKTDGFEKRFSKHFAKMGVGASAGPGDIKKSTKEESKGEESKHEETKKEAAKNIKKAEE
jgi:hypothetical protein